MGETYEIGRWRELASSRITFPIDLKRTALVCVDMQRKTVDATSPRGFTQTIGKTNPELAQWYFKKIETETLPNAKRLQAAFRKAGARVVHFVVGPKMKDGSDLPFAFKNVQQKGLGAWICFDDPEFQLHPEVAPLEGELVIHKVTMGGFTGTGAEEMLRNMGIDTIVLIGGHTHACVESSGRAAADLGFKVAVVEDAVINYMPLLHDAAMLNFAGFIGRVTTTDELLDEIGAGMAKAAAKPAAGRAARA